MKKTIIISSSLVALCCVLTVAYFTIRVPKLNLIVQSIDSKGVFVGDEKMAPGFQQTSKIYPKLLQEQEEHQASLRAIDEAWDNIGLGDVHFKASRYEEAARAYEKAYSLDAGSRHVSGIRLAKMYEKLNRYNDGIALLDEMIEKSELSEKGIQKATEIRARLLAAKNRT